MALLNDTDREAATRNWVRKAFADLRQTATLHAGQIRAAVDAADQWCDDNAGSFNTALPTPFKTTATLAQKSILLAYVALKRGGVL